MPSGHRKEALILAGGGFFRFKQEISPLRFAPVEMTGVINGHQGISPLRFAPVEMTSRRIAR
jgi:hypothetical protein